eukprot:gene31223-6373_t
MSRRPDICRTPVVSLSSKMLNTYAFLFVSVLLLTAGSRAEDVADDAEDDEYADMDRAHLVMRKSVTEEQVVQGRTVTVNIDIYNSGSSTASNVVLEDYLPEGAILVDGELKTTWGKIAVGSHAKHTYSMIFSTGGSSIMLPLASIKYTPDDSEDVQVGMSSTQSFIFRTPLQYIMQYMIHGGKYLSLGFARNETDWRNIIIVFVVIGGFFGINGAIKAADLSSTSRKRNKALADLKME